MEYKISQTNITIQGPAVVSLIQIVQQMYGLGAPTIYDDQGFNKTDHISANFQAIAKLPLSDNTQMPIQQAVAAVQSLGKYRKTQLAGTWEQLYANIEKAINGTQGKTVNTTPIDKNKILYRGKNRWGSDDYYIFSLTPQKYNSMLKLVGAKLGEIGQSAANAWKAFYKNKKAGLDLYQIDPRFTLLLKDLLTGYGYDTSEMVVREELQPNDKTNDTSTTIPGEETGTGGGSGLGKFKIKQVDLAGEKLTIVLGRWSTPWNNIIRNLKQTYTIGYQKHNYARIFTKPDKVLITTLINAIKNEFDVTPLEALLAQVPDKTERPKPASKTIKTDKGIQLNVANVLENTKGKWHIAILLLDKWTEEGKTLLDIIKFICPAFGKNESRFTGITPDISKPYDPADRSDPDNPLKNGKIFGDLVYFIKGDYNQYRQLSAIFKKYGFDTRNLNKIIAGLVSNDIVEPTRVEGDLDGYQKEVRFVDAAGNKRTTKVNDHDKFIKELDTYNKKVVKDGKEIDFSLYPLQREGIAFLYGRHAALLGDATGVGKCKIGTSHVQTSLGDFEIQDIWNKFAKRIHSKKENEEWGDIDENLYVHSIDENNKVVKSKINDLYREKFKGKLLKYKTDNGKETVVTKAHKFLTENGWKNNLSLGDTICSSSNQFSIHESNKTEKDIAYLIAWQIAEGCELDKKIHSYTTMSICQKDISVLEKISKIIKELKITKHKTTKEINPRIKQITRHGNSINVLELASVNYKKYLENLGYTWGLKSKDKIVPEFIMNSSDEVVKSFLQAFFDAEGYTAKQSRRIAVTSASKKLIYQISLLLQRFNIFCTYRKMMKCATNETGIKRPYYEIKISGSGMDIFMQKIEFSYDYKMNKYNKFAKVKHNYNKEGKPVYLALKPFFEKYELPPKLIGLRDKAYINGDKWMNDDSIEIVINKLKKFRNNELINKYAKLGKSKWTNSTTAVLECIKIEDVETCIQSLKKLKNNDLQYEKIISVEEIDHDGYIYDLSIEKTHNYISDNLICHNTIETILAADMRMKHSGGSAIIITLSVAQEQWASEVEKFAKHNPTDISLKPEELKTWTILTYPMFQTKSTREATVAKLQSYVRSGKVTCLILDESHSVKNSGASRTKNIQNVSNVVDMDKNENILAEYQIPFVWGASATVVANRPVDVYNQLKAINHPLGKLSFANFAKEFGGMKPGRYGYEDASLEEQVKAANKLKEWLINFGVYIARTKKDIREDMPELYVDDEFAKIDQANLYNCVSAKVSGYKKPDLPISVMMATRDCLALAKTPHSLTIAEPILRSGKRVMIFTAFKAAARYLEYGLQNILDSIGDGGQCGKIVGGMHKGTRSENITNFKNPNSNTQAMVLMIQAGGTGLDFPNVVEDVIENDFDWTPASNEQMKGRGYRITSKLPVRIKSVIAEGTEDEDFKQRVDSKIEVAEIIMKLTKEQLELFSLSESEKTQSVKNRLQDIEQQLIDAVKLQVEQEETEAEFETHMADQIRNKMGMSARDNLAKTNWYRKLVLGENK